MNSCSLETYHKAYFMGNKQNKYKKYIGHQIVIGTRLRMKLGKKIVMGNRVFILNRVSRKDPTGKVRFQQRPEGAIWEEHFRQGKRV